MDGYILIDKPAGMTSHDVVAKIRTILATETGNRKQGIGPVPSSKLPISPSPKVKVGHTGTLDPFATGLLILVLGKYTKRAEQFSKLDKTYEAELTLGKTSTTGDPEGKITSYSSLDTSYPDLSVPKRQKITEVLKSLEGEIMQKPHKYSAVKIGGQRAYKLARAGKEVEIEPRKVEIRKIELNEYKSPKLKITTEVSSGTYIRTLAEDIGEKLATGAYLTSLRRTRVGSHDINEAMKLDDIKAEQIARNLKQLQIKV